MKAEDLMIGDWIYFHHNDEWDTKVPGRVSVISKNNTEFLEDSFETKVRTEGCIQVEAHDGIQFWYMREGAHFEPIQLTKEILEKNGFKKETTFIDWRTHTLYKVGYDMYIIMNYYEDDNFTLCNIYDDSDEGAVVIDITSINYVHELQHALKLCKIDKEIIV